MGSLGKQYHLRIFDTKIRFTINDDVGPGDIPYTFQSGTWYHVAGAYDGSQMKVYVNGNLVGTPSSVSVPIAGTDGVGLSVGWRPSVNYFHGSIDEVRVYDKALTQQEIAALAGQGAPGEICNNGIDDDGDSNIDCADNGCFSDPFCGGGSMSNCFQYTNNN